MSPHPDRAPSDGPSPVPALRRRAGSILIAVLAVIMLLSFLITRFMEEAVEDLEYRALFNEPVDLRTFAHSMLEVALAVVHEVALIEDGKLYAPEQGWGDPIDYAGLPVPNGWTVAVEVRDEGGKLPINTMNESALNRLLEETLDFDFGTARALGSVLLDWIDPNEERRLNGAESEEYLDRDPPYRAANGPLQSLEELRLLEVWEDEFFDEEGRPNELFERLDDLVSVVHAGPVNLNSAPAAVLESLSEGQPWDPEYIFDGLDEPYLKELPASIDQQTAGTELRLLRVTVSVRRGEIPYTVSALVEPRISEESASGGSPGGRPAEEDQVRTGSREEQDAIRFPFKILQVTEYGVGRETAAPGRYSAVDIDPESF